MPPFDFPASPTEGQTYRPAGGPSYVFHSPVWQAVAADAADAPSDGGEYVRVNGAWRLKAQTFHPTAAQTVLVPPAARLAKIAAVLHFSAAGVTQMRWSLDGSTFLSGATDYSAGGQNFFTGSNANAKVAITNAGVLTLHATNDNLPLTPHVNAILNTKKAAGDGFTMRWTGTSYNNAAANLYIEQIMFGYSANAAALAATQIAAFQIFPTGAWEPGGDSTIEVEWIY